MYLKSILNHVFFNNLHRENADKLQRFNFDFAILIIVAVGVVLGIFIAAGVISMLLKKFRRGTYCLISGLIIGSVPSIFPSNFAFDAQGIIGIVVLIIGLAVPFLTELPAKKKAKTE